MKLQNNVCAPLSRHVDIGGEVWNDGSETGERSDGAGVRLTVRRQKASTQTDKKHVNERAWTSRRLEMVKRI